MRTSILFCGWKDLKSGEFKQIHLKYDTMLQDLDDWEYFFVKIRNRRNEETMQRKIKI